MDDEAVRADSIHLHLENLWKVFRSRDYESGVVHLGVQQNAELVRSAEAHNDGSLDMRATGLSRCEWRGLPIVVHCNIPRPIVGDVSADSTMTIQEPFCLYIEGVKRNGRREYIDDRRTDPVFL